MLAGKLSLLINESLTILKSRQNEAKPSKMTMIRHKITEFHEDDTGGLGFVSTNEPFERLDWSSFIYELVSKDISQLPAFKEIVEEIVHEYDQIFLKLSPSINRKSQTEFWLSTLLIQILREQIEGKMTASRIIELITIFENEINCGPIENKVVSYLKGMRLKTDSITLDRNTTIRKLYASDFEYEGYAFAFPISLRSEMNFPSSVIEIKTRTKDDSEINNKLDRILLTLRLFRLGSVHSLWNDMTKLSAIWTSGTYSTWSHSGFTESYKYDIQESDVKNLQKFYSVIEPLIQTGGPVEDFPLSIALTRYSNSLLEPVDTERKIMTAMMGLESLYSMPSDKGEIGYRISLRIARLFSFLGFDSSEVRKNVEKSYFVRSSVAHGLRADEKKIGKLDDLSKALLEYLRLSLIVFTLVGATQKNRFVASIDNSLVDVAISVELKNQIAKIAEQIPEFPVAA